MQIGVGRILRAAHVLHGEAELLGVLGVGAGGGFEDVEESGAVVPAQGVAPVDDHVAVERRKRDEAHVLDAHLGGEIEVVGLDSFVYRLR